MTLGVDQQPDAGRRIELDHQLARLGKPRPVDEPQLRRPAEHDPQLGLRDRQALPGPDKERHARPAPVVDIEPQRRVGLGRRVRRDPVDRPVAVVLTADVVSRIGRRHRAEHREQRVLERVRVARRGRLHRRGGDHLHQVVDDHVAQRPDRVVEVTAVLDAEALGHRDLDRRDVVAVPDRLEHRVREPQIEDLARAPSSPGSDRSGTAATRRCTGGSRPPARAPTPDRARTASRPPPAPVLGEPGLGQPLDHGPEQKRRNLEIEHRAPRIANRALDTLVRRRVAEVPAHVGQPRGEAIEHRVVDLGSAARRSRHARACGDRRPTSRSPPRRRSGSPAAHAASSRYSELNVITFARSPVIPNTTNTSAVPGLPSPPPPVAGRDSTAVVMGGPFPLRVKLRACSGRPLDGASPHPGDRSQRQRATGRPRCYRLVIDPTTSATAKCSERRRGRSEDRHRVERRPSAADDP